jgi:streptogramin lyase
MIRPVAFGLALLAVSATGAFAADVVVHDAKSQPESLTVAPDGAVIAGSASSPFVYRVKKGASAAEVFVDASKEPAGTFFLGQLADGASNTLWTCLLTPVPNTTPAQRHTSLVGYDLGSGKETSRWALPGDNTTCNDFAFGPDKALYITDTGTGRIYRQAAGSTTPALFFEHRLLQGVDGITFLDGVMYVNNVVYSKLYRVPVDAAGKPGAPVDIWMDMPVRGPDGVRAGGGKLYQAENGSGRIDALTITGDTAHVTVLKSGLVTPTGVEYANGEVWFTERGTGKIGSMPAPK